LAAETERRNRDLEAKFQEDLQRMSVEEAQRRKELEEEKQRMIDRAREEETQHRMKLESAKASLDAQIAIHQEHMASMTAAQERSEREHNELMNRLTAEWKASDMALQQQWEQQRRDSAATTARLEATIQQLKNRKPQVIHIYHRRRFLGIF
jgi:hypothetical protein